MFKDKLSQLASQTAIYGIPSIIGRVLNWLLIPIYTSKLVFTPEQYGIITEMYSYVSFLVILMLYGMENAFFKFYSSKTFNSKMVFNTISLSIISTSTLFIVVSSLFAHPIAQLLGYPNNEEFVSWFALIIGLDAVSAIALAKLRQEGKATKFATISGINILINIGLNLFFLSYCMPQYKLGNHNWIVSHFYNSEIQVGYVFISNLIASCIKFSILIPIIFSFQLKFSKKILKQMLLYGLPLLVFGLSGIVNDNLDKLLLKFLLIDSLGEQSTMTQLGIYGACYKLSIIIVIFIQGFKYAVEPFIFSTQKDKNALQTYAKVTEYFCIVCGVIFLLVLLNIDIVKYFISNPAYWQGLSIVPILFMANIFSGLFYNLSVWYKLSNKTIYGAYIGIGGALITILFNVLLIPLTGYTGAAWTTLACYGTMALASYFIGQKKFPIPYDIKKIVIYLSLPVLLLYLSNLVPLSSTVIKVLASLGFVSLFLSVVFIVEKKT